MRFWIRRAIRESRYRTSFSSTKFFFDCDDIFVLRSRRTFWAVRCQCAKKSQELKPMRTRLKMRCRLRGRAAWYNSFRDGTILKASYLLRGHPQSAIRLHWLTWTCKGQTWKTAWIGAQSASHHRRTLCFGATRAEWMKMKLLTPWMASEAWSAWRELRDKRAGDKRGSSGRLENVAFRRSRGAASKAPNCAVDSWTRAPLLRRE